MHLEFLGRDSESLAGTPSSALSPDNVNMSTIASPRASITSLVSPTSSSRASLDGISRSRTASPSGPSRLPLHQQRNRSALRDYYNLKPPSQTASSNNAVDNKDELQVEESELDRGGFDAEGYVKDLLSKEGLDGILRAESRLVNEIRFLDGERKALVYDNYSKLISATDTIRKAGLNMRTNMEPLSSATSTLSPAISHIADTSSSLASSLQAREPAIDVASLRKEKQRARVQWVLDAPKRIQAIITHGNLERARNDWKEVQACLDKWQGVNGVAEVRRDCEDLFKEHKKDSS